MDIFYVAVSILRSNKISLFETAISSTCQIFVFAASEIRETKFKDQRHPVF